ncbi:protein of unknown function [Nitratireductor aquimarinus]
MPHRVGVKSRTGPEQGGEDDVI